MRTTLRAAARPESIPALRLENGSAVIGEKNILAFLAEQFIDTPQANAHRQNAATLRRHSLEEQCECSQLATR